MKVLLIIILVFLQSCKDNKEVEIVKENEINFQKLNNFASNQPGASILVIKDDKVIIKKSYGVANLITKKNIDENTLFELGSVSKIFTGYAISKLIKEGKMNLEDSANKYLPKEYNFFSDNIKVRHLLFHTSGLNDYLNDKSLDLHTKVNSDEKINNSFLIGYLKKQKNKKLENFFYSNSNYVLLSLIIENISGLSYQEYMKKEVFERANMLNTTVHHEERVLNENESKSYSQWPIFDELKNKYNYLTTGDFGIQSSINDFEKWINFIKVNNILETYQEKGFILKGKNKISIDYGYGMRFKKTKEGEEYIYHRGYINGASNIFLYNKRKNVFIIILSNTSSMSSEDLAEYILKNVN